MILNEKMKELRKENELKQSAIAKELNITAQQYQLYESGKRKIPIDKFIELCKFYKISPNYMLGFQEEFRKAEEIKEETKIIEIKGYNIHIQKI